MLRRALPTKLSIRQVVNTSFGYKSVSSGEERQELVNDLFHRVATRYDIMNDVMSGGIHRLWKNYYVRSLRQPKSNIKVLDMCAGTGDITDRILAFMPKSTVTMCDINGDMLAACHRDRQDSPQTKDRVERVQCAGEHVPFEDGKFDLYTISFGMRNCKDFDQFSLVTNPVFRCVYDWYSMNIIPIMGEIVADDYHAYKYLVESIRVFPNQEEFKKKIEDAGFSNVQYENLTCGIAAIHTGVKL
ncbi:hypothetical protein ACOME3_006979 [Neoechinorhynchus agilis]